MENTVIQYTILKFDQSQKTQIFNKSPEPQIKQKKTDLVKKNSSGNTGRE